MLTIVEKQKIIDILNSGGIVAFPTDTVWGVGCIPENEKAVQKIYKMKNRPEAKPLILMSSDVQYLTPYIYKISDSIKSLIKKYFPGALTIVTSKSEKTPSFIVSGGNTVGFRVPDHHVFAQLADLSPTKVLATTSANISGTKAAMSKEEVEKFIGTEVDYIIDDFGHKAQGIESTVVLVDKENVKVLRQGAIRIKEDE